MAPIRKLPASVTNKIAAGEVVERPASAVKELVENAIDAGAKSIAIDVTEGGRDLIRIVDDGAGIPREELYLAVEPHATSKLIEADDLFRVRTMGFRGEALASIAGVSDFSIRSRPAGQPAGALLEVEHGRVGSVRDCGCPVGTQIEARNLFASVPVRRKFLKSKQTEIGYISEMVERFALSHPGLALRLTHNERVVLERPAEWDRRMTIASLLGQDVAEALLAIDAGDDDLRVQGFACDPRIDRPNNRAMHLFVNGRFIRDRSLAHAMTEAYRGLLMTGRYPVVFLFVELPCDRLDVNVHPTKTEVRFQDPHQVYSLLLSALRNRFLAADLTARLRAPGVAASISAPAERRSAINEQFALAAAPAGGQPALFHADRRPWSPPVRSGPPSTSAGSAPSIPLSGMPLASDDRPPDARSGSIAQTASRLAGPPRPMAPQPPAVRRDARSPADRDLSALSTRDQHQTPAVPCECADPPARAIQLHNSYLVVETSDGMLLIDQHALHERILFERLRQKLAEQALEVQTLLVPEPVELDARQVGILLEHQEVLRELGVHVEEFGDRCVLLQSYPAMLRRLAHEELLRDLAGRIEETGRAPSRAQLLEELLHLMACKAAVKAGDPLEPQELDELVRQRHLVDDSHHCPHGRPTTLRFTLHDLERQFRRV